MVIHKFKVGDLIKFKYKNELTFREVKIARVYDGMYSLIYLKDHCFYSNILDKEVMNYKGEIESWKRSRIDMNADLIQQFQWRQW